MDHELRQLAKESPVEAWISLPFVISARLIQDIEMQEVIDCGKTGVRRTPVYILERHGELGDLIVKRYGVQAALLLTEYAVELDRKEEAMRLVVQKVVEGADGIIIDLAANNDINTARALGMNMGLKKFMDKNFESYRCVLDWDPWIEKVDRYIRGKLGEDRYNLIKFKMNEDFPGEPGII